MKLLIWVIAVPIAVIGIGVAMLLVWWGIWAVWEKTKRHDPIEYYRNWGGYVHPIGLYNRITKEEADACHAEGSVYLVAHYSERKLIRVTKMLKGQVFFDFEYTYHPNGKCKTVKTTNAKGVVKVRVYDQRGRNLADNPSGFW